MRIPEDLKYTKDHEWVRVAGDTATVGITEFAQAELGDIVFVDLPAEGKLVKQGETLCVVESTKAASDVYVPVGGKILSANSALSSSPELVNSSPYDQGWLVKLNGVQVSDLSSLMSAAEYQGYLGEKAA